MPAYYNEIEPFCVEWLRNLVLCGLVADGEVDTRSIEDVSPADLRGFTQCHFFAGIGVWSRALRLAGWPDDRRVWTGSCPCQPFSAAGAGAGFDDERHLWPDWHWLIDECRPPVVLGEQVASKSGLEWLDAVHADLAGSGYVFGAADLCAAGVGAPHIRQRLWFVGLADDDEGGRALVGASRLHGQGQPGHDLAGRGAAVVMGDAGRARSQEQRGRRVEPEGLAPASFWSDLEWLACRDGKYRPTQPGLQPLAHGTTARVGRLRAYGNAIVAPVAAAWIQAVVRAMP